LIVVPIALRNKEFLYVDTEESTLCLDQTRLYYIIIDGAELYHCKTMTTVPYIYTQSHALMCTEFQSDTHSLLNHT
jgi:hypothetical protein